MNFDEYLIYIYAEVPEATEDVKREKAWKVNSKVWSVFVNSILELLYENLPPEEFTEKVMELYNRVSKYDKNLDRIFIPDAVIQAINLYKKGYRHVNEVFENHFLGMNIM